MADKCLSTWFLYDRPYDEEASHEANVFDEGDVFRVDWSHVSVGQVTSRRFATRAEAEKWLADAGYQDFTA